MIVEVIRYQIAEGQEAAFEDAYRQAQKSLADSSHCLGYQLVRCLKRRSRYLLLRCLYAIVLSLLLCWVYLIWYWDAPGGRIGASQMLSKHAVR